MNWIDRILMAVAYFLWKTFKRQKRNNPFFIVIESEENGPYMVRYKIFRCPWFKVFLHHILRSDEDVELHDHPWNFVSLILWSGYFEVLPQKRPMAPFPIRRIRAGDVVRHRAEDAHRLILQRPAWTLVVVTGKSRHWGFWAENGWMPYEKFFDRKYGVGNWVSF